MTTWGGYLSIGSGASLRVGLDFSYSPSTVTPTTNTVTVSWTLRAQLSGASASGTDNWTVSGDATGSGSKSWSINGNGGTTTIASGTKSVSLIREQTQKFTLTGTLFDAGPSAADPKVTASMTVPARPVDVPAAPSGLTVTRSSDSRQNLSWTHNGTAIAPYASQRVRRDTFRDGAWQGWAVIANISATASSYADTSTMADRKYRYAVEAVNSAGSSGWHYGSGGSNGISTTPARATTAPTAQKTAGGDIVLTRPALSSIADEWDWQWSGDGGASWVVMGLYVPISETTVLYDTADPTKTHMFQVRPRVTNPALRPDWSPSSQAIQLEAPPNAPTNLAPAVADATEAIVLSWAHNPVDTTPQRRYQLRYRVAGTSTWTTPAIVTATSSQATIPAGTWTNGQQIEWQVATWGNHATGSSWSASQVMTLSARPVAGVTTPGGLVTGSRLTLTWSYHDEESSAQARWSAELVSGGQVVESRGGYGDAHTTHFAGTTLADGATYTVRVRVMDGHGLWSEWAERTFAVDYLPPPTPTLAATFHKDEGYTTLTPDVAPAGTGEVEAVSVSVWRAGDGGWVLVADELAPGTTVTDMIPPLGTTVTYRAIATSALPSTAESVHVPVDTSTRWVFFNFGPGFGSVVRLWGNLSASQSVGRQRTLHHFAGRPDPVEFAGGERTRTYEVTGRLFAPWQPPDKTSTAEEFFDLADAPAPVCVRDPEGVRLFCSVGEVPVANHLQVARTVSVPLTKISWAEDVQA